MTKHGICQGIWSDNRRVVANPEWNLCYYCLKSHIEASFNWKYILTTPPKHLLAYGKKPKLIK
jgi:hypothetical protein